MLSAPEISGSAKLIYESSDSLIYCQHTDQYKNPVIIKILRQKHPGLTQIVRFTNEYECLKDINVAGVRKVHAKTILNQRLALVLEFIRGQSIKQIISGRQMDLESILITAVSITRALENIHANHLIHKDINSSNIIVDNHKSLSATIIDFGISSRIDTKTNHLANPDRLEGTLAYISPEQTGRMNRSVDYRTDLYSLGVTLYEMLTGKLPFETQDSLEMIHSHIARVPVPVYRINNNIPRPVSDIVTRLMAKNAEDRYQSAYGLKADLETCLNNLNNIRNLNSFIPGYHDISGQFNIPQKLYGREKEVSALMDTFEQVSLGKTGMVLVSGYPGVGKSSLVHEIHKPVTERRGYFVSGKYDQYQHNKPYAALIQAMTGFVNYILGQSPEKLALWKTKISKAAGSNGQVLIDLIPALELIIGSQPPVPNLGPAETQNRINLVFLNLIKTISSKEHPFVIFTDDLQWADPGSLNLIKLLMNEEESRYLLIIGAYRDNEVDPAHLLMMTINDIQTRNLISINKIRLDNLLPEQVNHLIADTLHCSLSYAEGLTELVYKKTRGNAFFVKEFFKSLYKEKLLVFDYKKRTWNWNTSQIQEKNITDNVVELMAERLRKLPLETQQVLKSASCIGSTFDINTLSVIYENTAAVTLARLWKGIEEGLVIPLDDNYKLLSPNENEFFSNINDSSIKLKSGANQVHELTSVFKFLHDRVQQAAYQDIPVQERKALHWKTGRLILGSVAPEKLEDRIFDIVNQLNLGAEMLSDCKEQKELAGLNLIAVKKTKNSAAYDTALGYAKAACSFLPENSWKKAYDLTLEIYEELAVLSSIAGDVKTSEKFFNIIFTSAGNIHDKINSYFAITQFYLQIARYQDAGEIARRAMNELGIEMPGDTKELKKINHLKTGEILKSTQGKAVHEILHHPGMTKQNYIDACRLTVGIWNSGYFLSDWDLMDFGTLTNVCLSLEHGNCEASAYGFVCYGMMLAVQGEYQKAYQFGRLAVQLSEKYPHVDIRGKVYNLFGHFVSVFGDSYKNITELYKKSFVYNLESGDVVYTNWALMAPSWAGLIKGDILKSVYENNCIQAEFVNKTIDIFTIRNFEFHKKLIQYFQGNIPGNTLDDNDFNESKWLEEIQESKFLPLENWYYGYKSQASYLYGNYDKALEYAEKAHKTIAQNGGLFWGYEYVFYYALSLIKNYPLLKENKKYNKQLDLMIQQLKAWSQSHPGNFFHKYALAAAETASVRGQDMEALELYHQAIESAKDNFFIQNEAAANELAGEFHLKKGFQSYASLHIARAYECYAAWGAKRKALELKKKYGHLFFVPQVGKDKTAVSSITSSAFLDTASIIKVSQTLSQEVQLNRLIENMLGIAMENAGATKGVLIIKENDNLLIQAKSRITDKKIGIMQAVPVEQSRELPLSVVHYAARTQNPLIINDLTRDMTYADDPYIRNSQLKSLICLPIIHQGKLNGLLYLENNLTIDAFTLERLDLLKVLAAQAAISIENAMLYENLETKVRDRTAELAETNRKLQKVMDALWGEMELAKRIQTILLPVNPHIPGYEIAASSEPANEVGGDYYDVISAAGYDWIVIGDVSGHGITSGLVMMMVQTAIHTVLLNNPGVSPSFLLTAVNRVIYENIKKMDQAKHMTILVLAGGREGRFSFSGLHEDILILRADTGKAEVIETSGFWIGMEPDISTMLTTNTLTLEPGDYMILFTDGVTEARCQDRMFGNDHLLEIIQASVSPTPVKIHDNIVNALKSCEKPDDVTIMVLKRLE
ncbi:Protein kinase and AAA ATPase domains-containing protein [Desulfonema limicola]|uniref:Protein kinase and AAA ATPase domains-containing protein n=1 Tax=Desulfonema limicola TaxID=45656 RepID=A0A975B8M4_9BACT|nr:AAA family ATPase [Desulfonema limicola]QTA80768.1 Protein kinase and AAA ATPase domains-containing protein [Desulfonema limicola]